MTSFHNCALIVKQHYPIVLIFAILFTVFIISTAQSDKILNMQITENQDFQVESRTINNDFRNATLDYLANLTYQIDQHDQKIAILEQKIINNNTV